MLNVLEISRVVEEETLHDILADLRRLSGSPATLLSTDPSGVVQPRVRRTTRVTVPDGTRALIENAFLKLRPQLEEHFGEPLGNCEEPQFLRYEQGDFFVAHQDGNTPLVFDQSRFRRVSVVLFLSTPGSESLPETYGGGALVFHGSGSDHAQRLPFTPPAGTVVAFRSETTHEVTPVTHGERYTIVSWFRAPET